MSDSSLTERQESLLSHLESVYLLAQAVTPDAAAATRLVEATYTQAFVTLPLSSPAYDEKRWLFRLLMQIHHEQVAFRQFQATEETSTATSSQTLGPLRHRLAQQLVDRILPSVLVTLPDEQRLILLVCDAEGLTCEEASFVLDIDVETACERLTQTRKAIFETVRASVSEQERQLLEESLPDNWLRPTLRRLVEAEFDLPSSALRHALVASMSMPEEAPAPDTASSEPPPLPATDRPARQTSSSSKPARPRFRRFVAGVFLIAAVGTLGYFASQALEREPETNLITLSVKQADAVKPTFATDSPEQAENYVLSQLGWRLTLPSIDQAELRGVDLREVAPGITVPVFLYEDMENEESRIALYLFTYALLDRYGDRIQLEPESLLQIQDQQRFDLHDLGERNALVWRNRDDIYIAVTPDAPETLRQRIVFPS